MSRRPRFLPPPMDRPERRPTPAWAIRLIVVVAVLVVAAALTITIATGTLFTVPGH